MCVCVCVCVHVNIYICVHVLLYAHCKNGIIKMTDIKIQMSEQECKNAYLVEEKHITHFSLISASPIYTFS